jgi:hypothetical protein
MRLTAEPHRLHAYAFRCAAGVKRLSSVGIPQALIGGDLADEWCELPPCREQAEQITIGPVGLGQSHRSRLRVKAAELAHGAARNREHANERTALATPGLSR